MSAQFRQEGGRTEKLNSVESPRDSDRIQFSAMHLIAKCYMFKIFKVWRIKLYASQKDSGWTKCNSTEFNSIEFSVSKKQVFKADIFWQQWNIQSGNACTLKAIQYIATN